MVSSVWNARSTEIFFLICILFFHRLLSLLIILLSVFSCGFLGDVEKIIERNITTQLSTAEMTPSSQSKACKGPRHFLTD
jgi:hypothetical protein